MSVYALGDLHGRLDLYNEVCNFIKPEDKVIFVGDAGDRGPEPWETIKALFNNPQFIYLLGNHEHMLMKAMYQSLGEDPTYYFNPISSCVSNGGAETLKQWEEKDPGYEWPTKLKNLPLRHRYINKDGREIIVCHSGFTPLESGMEAKGVDKLIWDRHHVYEAWPGSKDLQNTIIVHGHTPVEYLAENPTEAYWYCGYHKVDIDTGAVWTGVACLLDLDTFDEHYFCGSPAQESEDPE